MLVRKLAWEDEGGKDARLAQRMMHPSQTLPFLVHKLFRLFVMAGSKVGWSEIENPEDEDLCTRVTRTGGLTETRLTTYNLDSQYD